MLSKKKRYLQIALNSNLREAFSIINQLPLDDRILIEAGTPLIKDCGSKGIRKIRTWWEARLFGYGSFSPDGSEIKSPLLINPLLRQIEQKRIERKREEKRKRASFSPYIVADLKCMDRGTREVEIAKEGGANAVTALGQAPLETLDAFVEECEKYELDSMIDMMNVEFPLSILRNLKKMPQVVILHRGVDEEAFNPEKEIPFHEIQRIKNSYDILIAIAGGDDFGEVQRAIFNDADIVIVWKSFYKSTADTARLAEEFLKDIR